MDTHTAGSRVYDIHGSAFIYVAPLGDKHVVRGLFDDGDGEDFEGEDQITDSVLFSEPPVQQQHAEMARLDAMIAERRTELSHFNEQAREMRRTLDRRPDIAALVDLLVQKPVYFVEENGGAITLTTERRSVREFSMEVRVTSGKMQFWLRLDRDYQSSDYGRIYQTREQAVERVREVIADQMKRGDRYGFAGAIKAAKGAGIEAPAGAAEKLREALIGEADKAVEAARAALAKATADRTLLIEAAK